LLPPRADRLAVAPFPLGVAAADPLCGGKFRGFLTMDQVMRSSIDLTKRLAQEVAVVTGGAQGIGRAISARLAGEGATVAILDANEAGAREAAACMVAEGRQAIGLACDVTSREQVRSAIAEVVTRFGKLTVLVNNAGIVRRASFLELTDQTWADVLGVNLTGSFIVAQEASRVMVAQGFGRIVNMASIAARIAHSNIAAYSVSKAGVEAMTRAMAFELAPFGIIVNAIAPGTIATSFALGTLPEEGQAARLGRIPVGRFGDAAEVAAVVAFLASSDAAYVTGSVIPIDGGLATGGVRDSVT
jgi:NAD(P)-dependent dehydrogenase (short-subunit alcohol dehydrogenase family)